jgi:hypothetical protein
MSQQIPYKLRDWIPLEKLYWAYLSKNPNAISLLEKNPEKICWISLSSNENAVHLLEKNFKKINWHSLMINPNALHLIQKYKKNTQWFYLGYNPNPNVIDIFNKYPQERYYLNSACVHTPVPLLSEFDNNPQGWGFNWLKLSRRHDAIHILEKFMDKICWNNLSSNPAAIHLLEKNKENINWFGLCRNPNAIKLIEENLDKFTKYHWYNLSANPSAIDLLEKHQDKIDWHTLSSNPAIFVYDYEAMRESHKDLKEELLQVALHPDRIEQWLKMGMELEDM